MENEKTTVGTNERRFCEADMRAEALENKRPVIRGYAAVFDQPSQDLGGFKEIIRRGAFKKTLKEADVRALFNHDPNYVLGRTKSGTLRLKEDASGLAIEIDPPPTQWANDLQESIRRGDISQMSFGFRAIKDKWTHEEKGELTRELLEAELLDVSPVTLPAYPQTTVAVRAMVEELTAEKEPEEPPLAEHSSIALRRRALDLAEKT